MAAAAVVLVLGFVLFGPGAGTGSTTCARLVEAQQGASPERPMEMPNMGNAHVGQSSSLIYADCPPTSGEHYNVAGVAPARPGFYGADARIGPGSWVHNLEHGFVVALYRCDEDGCPAAEELDPLRAFIARGPSTASSQACGYQSKVIAARFDDMATPFALLAWDRLLLLDAFDVDVALDFAQRWIDTTGPEDRC